MLWESKRAALSSSCRLLLASTKQKPRRRNAEPGTRRFRFVPGLVLNQPTKVQIPDRFNQQIASRRR